MKFRIAIFASGTGTNADAIMKYFKRHPSIEVSLVVTNNPKAGVIERAKRQGVHCLVLTDGEPHLQKETGVEEIERSDENVLKRLKQSSVSHIILAGYLKKISPAFIQAFKNRILNIHPALLPKYGGKGMYGHYVHEAVKNSGDTQSGITIHLVDEKYDNGTIQFQARCPVQPGDSADDIAQRVHRLEYRHYPGQIEKYILSQS